MTYNEKNRGFEKKKRDERINNLFVYVTYLNFGIQFKLTVDTRVFESITPRNIVKLEFCNINYQFSSVIVGIDEQAHGFVSIMKRKICNVISMRFRYKYRKKISLKYQLCSENSKPTMKLYLFALLVVAAFVAIASANANAEENPSGKDFVQKMMENVRERRAAQGCNRCPDDDGPGPRPPPRPWCRGRRC